MDFSRFKGWCDSMKVFLAAYETAYGIMEKTTGLVEKMAPFNVFCTFWYEPKTRNALTGMKKYGHKGTVIIDSGAHSFFGFTGKSVTAHFQEKPKKEMPDPYLYFEKYISWLDKFRDYFDFFVELDLQEIVGEKTVNSWRKRIIDKGLAPKMITVWHSVQNMNGFDEFIKMSESKYIGVEGIRGGKITLPYGLILKKCYESDVKVHGFAFTRGELLYKLPFYSVDSSTWRTPSRFGGIPFFDKKTGRVNVKTGTDVEREKRILFQNMFDPVLMSHQRGFEAEGLKYLNAAKQFMDFQKHITNIWEGRNVKWKD